MMRPQPPLAIARLTEDQAHRGWYSRGHHPIVAFLAAIDALEGAPQRLAAGQVRHTSWRDESAPPPDDFPVTVIEGPRTRPGRVRCIFCALEQSAQATTCPSCGHHPALPRIGCNCARCAAPAARLARLVRGGAPARGAPGVTRRPTEIRP